MADAGHDGTEKIIKRITRDVTKEYRQAAAEVQAKLNDYLRRFRIKDALKLKALQAGQITVDEYKQWRLGQIMIGKRWAEMQDALARDLHNANNIARSIVNGYMPEVYALNHNYGTFLVEKGSLIDTSYSLYSRQAVERLIKDQPELLRPPGVRKMKEINAALAAGKDIRWQKGQIQSVMTQAILQGESIPNIARRIAQTMGEKNLGACIRYARTAATAAQNAGREDSYKRAQGMGIKMRQMWIATLDDRTRVEHRFLDGQVVDVGEPFVVDNVEIEYPGDPQAPGWMTYNCRCTTIPQIEGFEIDHTDLSLRMNSKLGAMTYEEWEKAKPVSHRITKQVEIEQTMKGVYGAEYRKYAKLGQQED